MCASAVDVISQPSPPPRPIIPGERQLHAETRIDYTGMKQRRGGEEEIGHVRTLYTILLLPAPHKVFVRMTTACAHGQQTIGIVYTNMIGVEPHHTWQQCM